MSKMPARQPTPEQADKRVQDTVARVKLLAEMAAKFPEPFRTVARQMPAWPVMRFRRETRRDSFWHVLYRLELGEDYPVDISHSARSHPSSALGQYLTRCVERLHRFRLRREWLNGSRRPRSVELKSLLELAVLMPPLSKATSDDWSRRVVVPLIMLCDAGRDEASCNEAALKTIWRHGAVKSVATFRSRLLTNVRQTLRSLAKAA